MRKNYLPKLAARLLPAILIASSVLASCEKTDSDEDSDYDSSYADELDDIDTPVKKDTTIYTLGIEYPYSYDWQRDTAYGNVNCNIVLFASQKRVVEIPAGPGTEISADPDKHRIIDGHVYSDNATLGNTIIFKDGEEIFRYEGEERICGIISQDNSVYTLGQNQSGFTFRENGEILKSVTDGILVGDPFSSATGANGLLYLDQEEVCYTYETSYNGTKEWHAVRGDEETSVGSGMTNLFDARFIDGELHLCGTTSGYGDRAVYFYDGKTTPLGSSYIKEASSGHITPAGDSVFFIMENVKEDGTIQKYLCKSDGSVVTWRNDCSGIWVCEEKYAWITQADNSCISAINLNGKNYYLDDSSAIMTGNCVLFEEGMLLIAATPIRQELSPVMWVNGKILAFALYGYLCGISLYIS